jgi:hypothetical protein
VIRSKELMTELSRVRPATTQNAQKRFLKEEKRVGGALFPMPLMAVIREDTLLVEVGPVTRLLNQGGREAVGIGLVVGQLMIHEIINLQIRILQ